MPRKRATLPKAEAPAAAPVPPPAPPLRRIECRRLDRTEALEAARKLIGHFGADDAIRGLYCALLELPCPARYPDVSAAPYVKAMQERTAC
jgi:hypothetical protein